MHSIMKSVYFVCLSDLGGKCKHILARLGEGFNSQAMSYADGNIYPLLCFHAFCSHETYH